MLFNLFKPINPLILSYLSRITTFSSQPSLHPPIPHSSTYPLGFHTPPSLNLLHVWLQSFSLIKLLYHLFTTPIALQLKTRAPLTHPPIPQSFYPSIPPILILHPPSSKIPRPTPLTKMAPVALFRTARILPPDSFPQPDKILHGK